jgi:hypothetical protein
MRIYIMIAIAVIAVAMVFGAKTVFTGRSRSVKYAVAA